MKSARGSFTARRGIDFLVLEAAVVCTVDTRGRVVEIREACAVILLVCTFRGRAIEVYIAQDGAISRSGCRFSWPAQERVLRWQLPV